jgi:hypothetical protein
MENPELIQERLKKWNEEANKLTEEKYQKLIQTVGL